VPRRLFAKALAQLLSRIARDDELSSRCWAAIAAGSSEADDAEALAGLLAELPASAGCAAQCRAVRALVLGCVERPGALSVGALLYRDADWPLDADRNQLWQAVQRSLSGAGSVTALVHLDAVAQMLVFSAAGDMSMRWPWVVKTCRVSENLLLKILERIESGDRAAFCCEALDDAVLSCARLAVAACSGEGEAATVHSTHTTTHAPAPSFVCILATVHSTRTTTHVLAPPFVCWD
jgi:hypothetical protein